VQSDGEGARRWRLPGRTLHVEGEPGIMGACNSAAQIAMLLYQVEEFNSKTRWWSRMVGSDRRSRWPSSFRRPLATEAPGCPIHSVDDQAYSQLGSGLRGRPTPHAARNHIKVPHPGMRIRCCKTCIQNECVLPTCDLVLRTGS
jgi:hypothetical protein